MPKTAPPTPAAVVSAPGDKKVWGPTTVRRAGRHRSRRRRGGLLTSRGTKLLLSPASLGSEGSMDTAKQSFGPTPARKAGRKGRKTRRRHRK